MKTLKIISLLFTALLLNFSCSDDDDTPEPVDEEEVITTMTIILSPQGGGTSITLQSRDLDGDGPNDPVITVSGNLSADANYDGIITLQNETEDPAEDITAEVKEEDEEHQFFFSVTGALTAADYADEDGNGNPLGLQFTLDTGSAGSGVLGVTLRHEPKKPNDGTLADAGGETDISQNFDLTIE